MTYFFGALLSMSAGFNTQVDSVGFQNSKPFIGSGAERVFQKADADFVPDEIIVKFNPQIIIDPKTNSSNNRIINELFAKYGVIQTEPVFTGKPKKIKGDARQRMGIQPDLSNIYRLKLSRGSDVTKIIKDFGRYKDGIGYAELNYIRKTDETFPNDPEFPEQWALIAIQAPPAWDIQRGSPNIVVAVIDSGVDYNHLDLAPNIWRNLEEIPDDGVDNDDNGFIDDFLGYDFVTANSATVAEDEDPGPADNDPIDVMGHGTNVAGIIAAAGNNGQGIAGLSWTSKIMALRAGYKNSAGESKFKDSAATTAIAYAADNGAQIINMSFGGDNFSQLQKDALDYAFAAGVVLIAAAGNDGWQYPHYPASLSKVISVGSIDHNRIRSRFSNYGPYVDIFAPGNEIQTTAIGNAFALASGTSFSSPYVAGLAALILSQDPNLDNEAVNNILINSADRPGNLFDPINSWGIINAYTALTQMDATAPTLINIYSPTERSLYKGSVVDIVGTIQANDFDRYTIEWGEGENPNEWQTLNVTLENDGRLPIESGKLGSLSFYLRGQVTIRIKLIHLNDEETTKDILISVDTTLTDEPISFRHKKIEAPPILFDVNNDEIQEVVITSDYLCQATLEIFRNNQLQTSFPYSGCDERRAPAIGDIDKTGRFTYITTSEGMVFAPNKNIPSWPIALPEGESPHSPTLADLDGDGYLDIITPTFLSKKIYAWDRNGLPLNGWPIQFSRASGSCCNGRGAMVSPVAVGDINQDNITEVVFSFGNTTQVYNGFGDPMLGWPKQSSDINQIFPPLLADLDGDGQSEIIQAGFNQVFVWRANGEDLPGWPINFSISNPLTIGDIDGDGGLDLATYTDQGIFAFNNNGSLITGLPYLFNLSHQTNQILQRTSASILVGDIDDDGRNELLFTTGDAARHQIQAWSLNTGFLLNWPKEIERELVDSPALGDVNGDGKIELLAASKNGNLLFTWQTEGGFTLGHLPWPMYRHDARNTGNYDTDVIPPTIEPLPVLGANANRPVEITAVITDNKRVSSARLYYRPVVSETEFSSLPMENLDSNLWRGIVPANASTIEGLKYYFLAHDDDSNSKRVPAGTTAFNIPIVDVIPPTITHVPVTYAQEGEDINLTLQTDEPVVYFQLFYRTTGETNWTNTSFWPPLTNLSFGSVAIPGNAVNDKGLEYFLKAFDYSYNHSTTPIDAPASSHSVVVSETTPPEPPSDLRALNLSGGTAYLYWTAPTLHIDGSPLDDLRGYLLAFRDKTIDGNWLQIDVRSHASWLFLGLDNHLYEYKLKAYDYALPPNYSDWSLALEFQYSDDDLSFFKIRHFYNQPTKYFLSPNHIHKK